MKIILPYYDPVVGRKMETQANCGLLRIMNPNSGPGTTRIKGFFSESRHETVAYIDLKAIPGDGVHGARKLRWKTVDELQDEKAAYQMEYGHKEGWFFDDASSTPQELLQEIDKWRGTKILNPGHRQPHRDGYITMIHENAGWLDAPKPTTPARCAVMALKCPQKDLKKSLEKAKGCAYFFAHHLNDLWISGKSAFNTAPEYWRELTK